MTRHSVPRRRGNTVSRKVRKHNELHVIVITFYSASCRSHKLGNLDVTERSSSQAATRLSHTVEALQCPF